MRPFALEAWGKSEMWIEVSQRHSQRQQDTHASHLTQGSSWSHTQTCVPMGNTGSHSGTNLQGLGLEAGGLPEDPDHFSTMLVIEEKGKVPKGLLGKGRTETRWQVGT